jgi:small GTP-binding protein
MESYDCLIKSVFIGNTGTGKSSIIERYVRNTFDHIHTPTIGVEFSSTIFNFPRKDNLKSKLDIKLHIWDLAGHTHFRNIIRSYYRHAKIVFFVFDKTDRRSFQDFEEWIQHFRDRLDEIQIVIIANKSDLLYAFVTEQEALDLANKYNALYFETSAKNNTNITSIFETTMKVVYDKIMKQHPGFNQNSFESYQLKSQPVKLDNPYLNSSCC